VIDVLLLGCQLVAQVVNLRLRQLELLLHIHVAVARERRRREAAAVARGAQQTLMLLVLLVECQQRVDAALGLEQLLARAGELLRGRFEAYASLDQLLALTLVLLEALIGLGALCSELHLERIDLVVCLFELSMRAHTRCA